MKWRWLLVPLPALAGLILAAALNYASSLPNPLFRVLISLSTLLFFAGLLASLILALVFLTRQAGLRQLNRTRDEMQANTADDRRRFLRRLDHELKNPLMAIRAGLANFANAPTADTRQSALSTVEAQTVRLSRLTGDLRKIAELETRPLERSAVDVEQLLNDVVEVNRDKPGFPGRRIQLIVPHAPWPLPAISGDWDLLFLAFHNLLDNAMKFCDSGDAIEVRGREDGPYVVVEVADTGPGISAADLPHIWEELYRGERGRAVPGSGLGLAMVRAIIERHGGAIRLNSRLNHGTVVTVRLPKSAAG
jgi:two-component system OmpR family sensor kinase